MPTRLQNFFHAYHPLQVLLELAVIWVGVFFIFRFLRNTRGGGMIKGLAILVVISTLVVQLLGETSDAFERLRFLYKGFVGVLAFLLIVVFQPELRQAMVRLGAARFFTREASVTRRVVTEIAESARFLSKSQFGALIVIERGVRLGDRVASGAPLDAVVSARLLESLFWPNNPLHDLAVVIRDDRILAANVQLPLAEEGVVSAELGSRHRAAVGITLDSDSIAVVVSEQTGSIRIAERGQLSGPISADDFAERLGARLAAIAPDAPTVEPAADSEPTLVDLRETESASPIPAAGRS